MHILVEREVDGARALVPQQGGVPWAAVYSQNILTAGWSGFPPPIVGASVIAWSGTPGDELFERDPRSFGPAAWDRFGRVCDAIASSGTRVLFRPHARHILCDVQRVVKFLADRPRERFGVALDAASLLEPSMLPKAPDHFRRAFETLGPVADMVWLTGVEAPESDDRPVRSVPLGEGVVGGELIARLWHEHCPEGTPVVIAGNSIEAQAAIIGRP